nr:unnamed protein product [Callosobruchus chinensis]
MNPSQSINPLEIVTPAGNEESADRSPLQSTVPEQLNYSPDFESGLPNGQPDTPQQPELMNPSQSINPLEIITPTGNEETADRSPLQSTVPEQINYGPYVETGLPNGQPDTPQQPQLMNPSQSINPLEIITPTENEETADRSPLQSTVTEQLNYSPDVETGLPNGQPDTPQQPELINPLESINPLEIITPEKMKKPLTEVPYNQPYLNS